MDVTLEKKLSGFKKIALEKVKHPRNNALLLNVFDILLVLCKFQLENILLTIHGRKDLVIEPQIIKILDSFANMTWLK
jgi:hypothetical protein